MMKQNIFLILVVAMMMGCGGDSVHDYSKGPSSSASTTGRINATTSNSNYYHTRVTIEAVKQFNLNGVAVDIALSERGDIAYIASGDGGLEVVDVSNPYAPQLLYSYDLPEYVNYVEVEDGIVYVAYIPEGLRSYYRVYAFDIYDPYRPDFLGSSQGKSGVGHSRISRDDYLYEVGREGLEIFSAGERVGAYYLHDTAYALALSENYLFIANGRAGLTILKTDIGGRVGTVH
jgi:hypothetical protein